MDMVGKIIFHIESLEKIFNGPVTVNYILNYNAFPIFSLYVHGHLFFPSILKDHFSQLFESQKLSGIVNILIFNVLIFKNIDFSHPKTLLIYPIFYRFH